MGRAYQNRKDSIAKTSDAKARVYSKYAREIYVTAKGDTTAGAVTRATVRARRNAAVTPVDSFTGRVRLGSKPAAWPARRA